MNLSKTQWTALADTGSTREDLRRLFHAGKVTIRRVSEDGGKTWDFYYRGRA